MSKNVMIPDCTRPFFEVEINGKKYRYRSGTEQEVPDDVAQVIEQHTEAHEKKPVFNGGSQPDLNQNDPTKPDYVKNRTHYDTRETVSIDYDGVLEGKEYVNVGTEPENPVYAVKVSSVAPTPEEVIGGTYSVSVLEGSENWDTEITKITEDLITQNDEASYGIGDGIMVCLEDMNQGGMSLTKGVWFLHFVPVAFFCNLSYIKKGGELKKIDPKYLPDGIGASASAVVLWRYAPDTEFEAFHVNGEVPTEEQWIAWAKAKTPVFVGWPDNYTDIIEPAGWGLWLSCGNPSLQVRYTTVEDGILHYTNDNGCRLTLGQYEEIRAAWGIA